MKAVKGIVIASLNIRSLFKHLDEIKLLLKLGDIDILLLQETFLNYSCSNVILDIAVNILYRCHRDGGSGRRGGGGVCAYVSNKYKVDHLEDWNLCSEDVE